MKKQYEAPSVEVVRFQYSDQVVASSGGGGDGGGSTASRESYSIPGLCEIMPIN
jgi:hypothetical protein